jgi:hypothetical protein
MIKQTYFNGGGFDQISAIANANQQADQFIDQGKGKRKEISRTFITFSENGAFYTATLQLNYETTD